uniref:Long-chain fatty acid transport protein n=1 Tax=Candidatus Berkiella aquae TaxID=295108 RepID=A0A0Q9YXF7_9GAMM
MKRKSNIVLNVALGLLIAGQAKAGGVMLYEIGSDDIGLAAAGYSARAQDPSTILTNPAGMTRLEGNQLFIGVQALYQDVRLTPTSASPFLGTENGGNPVEWFPGGSFFYSQTINDFIKAGIGIYGNFGSSLSYDDAFVGRYSVISSTLLGMTVQPTIALELEGGLSVGAGLMIMNGFYRNKVAVNNSAFAGIPFPDGLLKLSDHAWAVGANVGLLYEPTPCTRFGLTYQSPIKLDFAARTHYLNTYPTVNTVLSSVGLLDANIDIGIEVPQSTMLSMFHQMTEQWAVLVSAGWQNWKRFGQIELGVSSSDVTSLIVDQKYKDSWHGAIGLQHQFRERWLINMGVGYDSKFQNPDKIPVNVPVNDAWRFGLGTRYAYRSDLDFGLAGEYVYGGNLRVDNHGLIKGDLVGTYKHAAVYFLGLNANWKCV